jgi:hypothetical protein
MRNTSRYLPAAGVPAATRQHALWCAMEEYDDEGSGCRLLHRHAICFVIELLSKCDTAILGSSTHLRE